MKNLLITLIGMIAVLTVGCEEFNSQSYNDATKVRENNLVNVDAQQIERVLNYNNQDIVFKSRVELPVIVHEADIPKLQRIFSKADELTKYSKRYANFSYIVDIDTIGKSRFAYSFNYSTQVSMNDWHIVVITDTVKVTQELDYRINEKTKRIEGYLKTNVRRYEEYIKFSIYRDEKFMDYLTTYRQDYLDRERKKKLTMLQVYNIVNK